ncbi:ATPase, AAA-type, core, P-loop containing nucleoside triphosphate hydrolase [Tanacetum coccineum]
MFKISSLSWNGKRSNKSIPAGLLLYGSPGTGKTSLSHALAREVNASFLPVAGEKLVANDKGVGRLTSLFTKARVRAPSVIFIDGFEFVKAVTDLMSKLISERRIKAPTTKSPTKLKKMLESKFRKSLHNEMPDLETRERMADVLLKEVKVDEEEKKTICQFLAYESDRLGMLEERQEIAVKHLSQTSSQGIDEFKNLHFKTSARQHRNLVKLLGCSCGGDDITSRQ